MLTNDQFEDIMRLIKVLCDGSPVQFPNLGEQHQIQLTDRDTGNMQFLIDIQRKTLNVQKCTYQTRFSGQRLLRVDIDGPEHQNPDGEIVSCPHIHIYREGFEDSWAYPLDAYIVTNTNDLVQVLCDFLRYNNIEGIISVSIQGDGLV